jgi:hypothetical protein
MYRIDGRRLYEETLTLRLIGYQGLNACEIGVAIDAFAGEGSSVVETGQCWGGLCVLGK